MVLCSSCFIWGEKGHEYGMGVTVQAGKSIHGANSARSLPSGPNAFVEEDRKVNSWSVTLLDEADLRSGHATMYHDVALCSRNL